MIFRYLEPAVLTPRLLAGFVAMPFVAALSAYLMMPFLVPHSRLVLHGGESVFEKAFGVAFFLFITAVLIVVAAAGPLFFWWRQHRRVSFLATMWWAGILGNIPLLLGVGIFIVSRLVRGMPIGDLSSTSRTFVIGTTAGLLCGLAFWLIALHPWRQTGRASRRFSRASESPRGPIAGA